MKSFRCNNRSQIKSHIFLKLFVWFSNRIELSARFIIIITVHNNESIQWLLFVYSIPHTSMTYLYVLIPFGSLWDLPTVDKGAYDLTVPSADLSNAACNFKYIDNVDIHIMNVTQYYKIHNVFM